MNGWNVNRLMFIVEICMGVLFFWGCCENYKVIVVIFSLVNMNDCKIIFEINFWSYFLICYFLNLVFCFF